MRSSKFKVRGSKKLLFGARWSRVFSNFEFRILNFLVWCSAAFAMPAVGAAQDSAVELRLESTTLEVGEVVDGQLVCTNTGQPDVPKINAPDGLQVQITNPIATQYSQTSILNGRRSQKTTFTYSLRLTAVKEGVFTLGPMVVSAEGASYQSKPVQVTVRRAAAQAQPDYDKFVFMNIGVEPRSLYVTQSFTATLTIGIRKIEIDGRVVEHNNLLEFVDAGGSDLSIFGTRFNSTEAAKTDSTGQQRKYVLFKTTKEVRAEEVGALRVGPVFIKMNYPTAFRRGIFGSEAARSRKETARAEATVVEVKGPPDQGRPADYRAAIGQYNISAEAAPTRVEEGRPLTLTLSIRGSPLEGVAGPDLSKQAELASRFDFAADELAGDVEGRAKVFRRAIFPKQSGEQTVPPISWSYFDPLIERYNTLTTEPIPIVVDPRPPGASPAPSTVEEGNGDFAATKLTVLRGGIAANYVDPQLVLASQSSAPGASTTTALIALPPLLWIAVTVGVRHRARLQTDVGFARRRRSKRDARARIAEALRLAKPAEQLHGLAQALALYVSDRFDLPPGESTPKEVQARLAARGLDGRLVEEITSFLESCDTVRYAPGLAAESNPRDAAKRIGQWVSRIERAAR